MYMYFLSVHVLTTIYNVHVSYMYLPSTEIACSLTNTQRILCCKLLKFLASLNLVISLICCTNGML